MRLTVLGCAGSFPGPESACSAYLVEADGFRLLLDFGSGSLSALQRYAGLKSVDDTLREAASIDGCNEWQSFRRVIFPSLRPINVVVAVITVIEALRAYDIIAALNTPTGHRGDGHVGDHQSAR